MTRSDMQRIDDVMLMAYVDGEVDATTAREIEQAIADDESLARRARSFRETATLARGAYGDVMHEPVPERLIAAIRSPAVSVATPAVKVLNFPMRKPIVSTWRTAGWAAAAAVAAVAIFAVGERSGVVPSPARHAIVQAAVVNADSERWVESLAGYFREYQGILKNEKRVLVDFGAEHLGDLEKWFGTKLNRQINVPDLETFGYKAQGGRFVIVAGKPAAQFLYANEKNELVALVVAVTDLPNRPGSLDKRGEVNVVHWRENGYAYAFVGKIDHGSLWRMSDQTWAKLKPV
jgi:anti-sigma factor RsiW